MYALIVFLGLGWPSLRAAEPVTLRVMTYNVAAGREASPEELAAYIRNERPDLVALQELDRMTRRNGNENRDFITRLGELTGMLPLYGKTLDFEGGHYGIGILTRHPYLNVRKTMLPKASPEEESRAMLTAEIELDGNEHNGSERSRKDTILFACVHIDYSTPQTRTLQLGALTRTLQQSPYPALLGGDFNALPDSPEIEARMRDWQPLSGPDYTYPAQGSDSRQRIDYLFGYPQSRWKLISTQTGEITLSDHKPVVSTVELIR